MQDRRPTAPNNAEPPPDFAPVPRKYRHDGWTPERQRAFIEALADTGSVSRACRQVNMSPEGAYYLRRQPGAEGFRRAWEAALDFGVQRLKDIAFERAIEGQLVPVFVAGKLMGFRRKKNDRLLMFCLRMNARSEDGRRLSASYFDPAADRLSGNPASYTVPLPTRAEKDDANAAILQHFDPVQMTLPEIEAMQKMLAEAAAQHRDTAAKDDPGPAFLSIGPTSNPYIGELEGLIPEDEDFVEYDEGEPDWRDVGVGEDDEQTTQRKNSIDNGPSSV